MPDLAAFQSRFATDLRDGRPRAPPGLAVYRNNVATAAIGALRSSFETVAMLLGDRAFDKLALDYFRAAPPPSPVLAAYGDGFADHVSRQPWLGELPYLADVARIDRLRCEAHLAADAEPFGFADLDALATDDWTRVRVALHPACRFGWFTTPATSIWLAHVDGEPAGPFEPDWRAEGVLVTRPDGAVITALVGRAEHRLLFGIWAGETVGEAAAAVATAYPHADISAAFARLIAGGALLSPRERN